MQDDVPKSKITILTCLELENLLSFLRNLSNITVELKKKKKICVTFSIHGLYQQLWDLQYPLRLGKAYACA